MLLEVWLATLTTCHLNKIRINFYKCIMIIIIHKLWSLYFPEIKDNSNCIFFIFIIFIKEKLWKK